MAGAFHAPLSLSAQARALRISIARDTGWTLADVDSLPLTDLFDYLAVTSAAQDLAAFRLGGGD